MSFAALIAWIYAYCTDFIISVALLTDTSYYEVNALLFCVLWPLLTAGLLVLWCMLKFRVFSGKS